MPDETDSISQPEQKPQRRRVFPPGEKISKINVADEIKNSFLDYSMSVIISRALPDVRGRAQPSQRRILYAMENLSLFPDASTSSAPKSAVIPPVITIRTAKRSSTPRWSTWLNPGPCAKSWWTAKATLVPWENDPPAAMRYTEARLTHLGALLMSDMEKDTVDFVPNYDERLTEPTVFSPAAFPNLLVNGGTGIAVGMATHMPPHNLGEVIDGICAQIDNPSITIPELMKIRQRAGFSDRRSPLRRRGHQEYFTTGKGSLKLRGRIGVEEMKGTANSSSSPRFRSNVNRAGLEEQIAALVNDKGHHGNSPRCATNPTSIAACD